MCQNVVMRDVQSNECVCNEAGQGARTGQNDTDAITGRVCEKMQTFLRDDLSLLRVSAPTKNDRSMGPTDAPRISASLNRLSVI
jgi:hypothetical protein